MFDQLGAPEILIILAVFLLLFGAKKLPDLARSLGRSSTEFRKGLKEGGGVTEDSEAKQAPAAAPVLPPENRTQEAAVSESKPEPEKSQKAE
ncbi:MAG: twin-arginine translocase TatA/TatE family subunit [Actinomycetota bacterium]